jgi:hypothetical protein
MVRARLSSVNMYFRQMNYHLHMKIWQLSLCCCCCSAALLHVVLAIACCLSVYGAIGLAPRKASLLVGSVIESSVICTLLSCNRRKEELCNSIVICRS